MDDTQAFLADVQNEMQKAAEAPIAKPINFPSSPFMQVGVFAVETHIDNLINTFGIDMVTDVLAKRIGRAA